MLIEFTKMQGVGNDYIYIDARKLQIKRPEQLARKLSDRHFGIGSDGLVLLLPAKDADVTMAMYNADGSEGMMCGNAVRCVAEWLYEHGEVKDKTVRIATKSGTKVVRRLSDHYYSVNLGTATVGSTNLEDIHILTTVSIGNPHVVWFPKFEIKNYNIQRIGQRIEKSKIFPNGTNVEFVRVIDENLLEMRVWERGSGETLGCGTGACAAAVASVARGFCNREELIRVKLPGGELVVDCSGEQVRLLGPAVTVYQGTIEIGDNNEN
ncbi:MAG: diaminopimelate epimerase [Clostridia bacterium]|nr:diaminopimelate epimerase [Clostridia bacterium]